MTDLPTSDTTQSNDPAPSKFLFVDSRVPDLQAIVAAAEPDVRVVVLDAQHDGVQQMAQALAGVHDVASIAVVAHSDGGLMLLGSGPLDADNIGSHLADLQAIGSALGEQGDILLYGCDVGAGSAGAAFLVALAQATGADVAGSTDAVGGDAGWDLEISTGTIDDTPVLRTQDLADYAFALHTTSVGTVAALKAALATAATDGSNDVITLTGNLTFASAADAITLNVTDGKTTTIVGGGFTLSGNNLSRVLKIDGGSVALDNITISNGFVTGTGGNIGSGTTGGVGADALGAGIYNAGTLTITNSTITSNKAAAGGGGGSQVGGGGGAGGGGGGFGSTAGGSGGNNPPYTGGSGSAGTGGNGGGYGTLGGRGGTTSGGAGGSLGGYSSGGAGGTANNGTIAIGGGGGGAGYDGGGGAGGSAAGGIYNAGTLTITGSSITNNIAAGGGGGGGATAGGTGGNGGNGGSGVGGIWNVGTLTLDTDTNSSLSTGNVGGAGSAGSASKSGSFNGTGGTATSTISTTGGASTTVVPSAPSTPDMTSGTDTGASNSDNLTGNATPTFTGTATAGATVTLYDTDGTTVLGSTTATGGAWSITTSTLGEGAHTVTAKQTISAVTSAASAGLAVTIDTTAPAISDARIDIAGASGNGGAFKIDDTVTATWNNTALGDNNADIAGVTVDFSSFGGGSAVTASNAGGTWTATYLITSGAIDGTNKNVSVTATDNAGNTTTTADTTNATVDNIAPTTTISTASLSSDTGGSNSDFITKTAAQTISGTTSANLASGESVQVSLDNGASWSAATATVGQNTWSLATTLAGSDTLKVRVMDATGNAGTVYSRAYVLDTSTPNAPSTPDMTSGTDLGSSSSDDVTADTTPTFTGTAESGSTVTLYDTDGITVLGTGTAVGGTWSITSSALGAGSHTVTAKATDAAGNTSVASSGLDVTVDATAPDVSTVAVPADGSYQAGGNLDFTVNFSEAVTVDATGGTPRLALDIGGSTVYAGYSSGSGSSALVFSYSVQPGDTDADGITVGALSANGGTLMDTAGNDAALTLNSVATTAGVMVDTTAPTVNSVSVPADGTYYIGQNVDFTVNFAEAVTVDTSGGTPRIAVSLDTGGTVYATYLSGSGTSALVFRHTVAGGEKDTTGVTVGALGSNGGTIRDAAGNDATLTLNSVGSTAAVTVDGSVPQVLDVTSSTADGAYNAGNSVTVTVTYSTAVTVDTTGGTPTLALNSGGTASYAGGSGTTTLSFTYTIGSGEDSSDLDYSSTGALALNGATIKDSNGSHPDASLTLFTPGASGSLGANKAIVVDTTAPSITFSSLALSSDTGSSGSDFVTNTSAQTITATLSAALGGGDVVYGSLDDGATWTDITAKVSGTTLTWTGVTLSGSDTMRLKVTDAAGNDGSVTTQAYTLDTTSPTVTGAASATADGSYHTGDVIAITVAFGEAVVVTGTPQLTLETGSTDRAASYASGSGTDTLTFNYTVQAGDTSFDLDYLGTAALALNGGAIVDAAGNAATLTLASPSAAGSLGANAALEINVNHAPTGAVLITGTASVGQVVSVDTSGLADSDGLGTLSYQWYTGGNPIGGATSQDYTIQLADISALLTVQVSYVDGFGASETVVSSSVAPSSSSTGGNGSDVIVGGVGNDVLDGGAGRDTMIGGAGDDTYYVERGDTIIENVGEGTDLVYSEKTYALPDNVENIVLLGRSGAGATGNALDNEITGNDGANRLAGGLGADTLTGGLGADRFVWDDVAESPDGAFDVVVDFNAAEGDRILLGRIDADSVRSGNQKFHYIGTNAFSSTDATGELRFDPGTHMLYASVDADATAEFAVQLTGVTVLLAVSIQL